MKMQQSGFTLIELIAVLVILGILAATAVPKFIDLSDEAQVAATNSIAGSIESASALNHAVDIAVEAGLSSDSFVTVANCQDGRLLLSGGELPKYNEDNDGDRTNDPYTIASVAIAVDKSTASCTLSGPDGTSATFSLISATP